MKVLGSGYMMCLACVMKKEERQFTWQEIQDNFAEANSIALVLLDENGHILHTSNDNSICQALLRSDYRTECERFCGKVHEAATADLSHVKCHAKLNYITFSTQIDDEKIVVILGRSFLKTKDYFESTSRAASGDWSDCFSLELFHNVHFSNSHADLEKIAEDFLHLITQNKEALKKFLDLNKKRFSQPSVSELNEKTSSSKDDLREESSKDIDEKVTESLKLLESRIDVYFWRRVFNSLLDTDYKKAAEWILQFLSERFSASSSAIFQAREFSFHKIAARGEFADRRFHLNLMPEDRRLIEVFREGKGLEMIAKEKSGRAIFFPIIVGNNVRHGLLVKDDGLSQEALGRIFKFCRKIAHQLEILRLRYELERYVFISELIKSFNKTLRRTKHIDVWRYFVQFCSEAMKSERCSLLFYDEKTGRFFVKFAIGRQADVIMAENSPGDRIAYRVFEQGRPLVVSDLASAGIPPAPADRKYLSESFISFPVILGNRKIGVLNITDRKNNEEYDEFDLELLKSIVLQISVAVERLAFMGKASEFEQLSITDELTQLNNRRYLEARLDEEIKRSYRTGMPLAFLMIDVDDFKHYNDSFGHTEGDKVLRTLAKVIKETLRASDVAARYGGEEFCVLLPQTTLREAAAIAERIRRRVEQTHFPNRKVTISIGVSACKLNCERVQVISSADKALYEAKRKGKNKVEVFVESD